VARYDIIIIGAGVIGVNLVFWLSELYDCSIMLVDKEAGVGFHQTSRNTGGVHRPVFLDPEGNQGKWWEKSYHLWQRLAQEYVLPWKELGRITLAFEEEDAFLIRQYEKWGRLNGMTEEEMELLDGAGIKKLEPEVQCVLGLVSKRESMTSYGDLCDQVFALARQNGIKFGGGVEVHRIREMPEGVEIELHDVASGSISFVTCSLLINAAGAAALKLARMLGLGKQYAELHLKGTYWTVDGPVVSKITRNIYPVTRHGVEGIDIAYMGPHLVTRYNCISGWRKELGPTAVPVLGPYAYKGFSEDLGTAMDTIFRNPFTQRLKLFTKRQFVYFAWSEWRRANSKESMVRYLKNCIPNLDERMVEGKGCSGIQWELIDDRHKFVNSMLLKGSSSLSILYGGAAATGAPAFCAGVVSWLADEGCLDVYHRREDRKHDSLWNFESTGEVKPVAVSYK